MVYSGGFHYLCTKAYPRAKRIWRYMPVRFQHKIRTKENQKFKGMDRNPRFNPRYVNKRFNYFVYNAGVEHHNKMAFNPLG